jgi:hypothetical protein
MIVPITFLAYFALSAQANHSREVVAEHRNPERQTLLVSTYNMAPHETQSFDLIGALLLITGLAVPMIALALGGETVRWNHPAIIASMVISPLVWLAFLKFEEKAQHALIPLNKFRDQPLLLSFACTFVFSAAHNSVSFPSYVTLLASKALTTTNRCCFCCLSRRKLLISIHYNILVGQYPFSHRLWRSVPSSPDASSKGLAKLRVH